MSADILGYNRTVKADGEVLTSEYAVLSMSGGGAISLVQQAQGQYGHKIQSVFEGGTANMYYITGQPEGQISFARLVGRAGLGTFLRNGAGGCGALTTLAVSLNGSGACANISASGGKGYSFSGAMIENIQFSYSTGDLQIQEGAALRVAHMK